MNRTEATPGQYRSTRLPQPPPGLHEALEHAIPGGVAARSSDRLARAHDASHHLLTPQAVVTATSAHDMAALFGLSREFGVPLTFRSGGTSLSGQASADGVQVDTRQNFQRIAVLDGGDRVRVQPGATVRQVNARLARHQRRLGPDPASEVACTVGGVVANNSSGMASGTELNTYRTLESALLVLSSGLIIDTSDPNADALLQRHEPGLYRGLGTLRDRVRRNPESLRSIEHQYSIKNTMGYGLNSFVDFDRPIDILLHLVIGSEGTLAFVAEATFRTVPLNSHVATGLLYFSSLRAATEALPSMVAAGFATIELLDATSLRVAQRDPEADPNLRSFAVDQHAALLVEFQEASADDLDARLSQATNTFNTLSLTIPPTMTCDAKLGAGLWHIRKGLYASVAGSRPPGTTALLEDVAVPVAALADTCEELIRLFARHGYEDSVIFGHAKDGNIHFLLNECFDDPVQIGRYKAFTQEMVEVVLSHGGTLKAEHGTGRIMAPFVRRQFGDELYAVMKEVKALCDPYGILNPGVLLNEDPNSHTANVKVSPTVEREVDRCVECGYCEAVCPSKDLTLTPRQRIVLRRETAAAEAAGDHALVAELNREYQYDGIDTCAVDGMCQTTCPVLIDTGDLVRRLRAERRTAIEQRTWRAAARQWNSVSRAGSLALTAVKALPAPLVTGAAMAARALFGKERFRSGRGTCRRAASRNGRALAGPRKRSTSQRA